MVQGRKTIEELIAEEQKKAEESRTRMMALLARKKIQDRKSDTRRKIVVGGAVLAHAEHNAAFGEELKKAIRAAVTRQQDKAVLSDFFAATRPTPPAHPEKAGDRAKPG